MVELVAGVRVVTLDDEAVVFNPFSWETHLLNPAAALLLERLQASPCSEGELAALLAEALDEAERPLADEHARRLVADLASLRLVVGEKPSDG